MEPHFGICALKALRAGLLTFAARSAEQIPVDIYACRRAHAAVLGRETFVADSAEITSHTLHGPTVMPTRTPIGCGTSLRAETIRTEATLALCILVTIKPEGTRAIRILNRETRPASLVSLLTDLRRLAAVDLRITRPATALHPINARAMSRSTIKVTATFHALRPRTFRPGDAATHGAARGVAMEA